MTQDVLAHVRMTFFGPPQVVRADGTAITFRSRKHLALLIYLVVEQPHIPSRDTLLALLWPEAAEEAARNNLRVALADLRRGLGDAAVPLLQTTRHTVQFNPASDHTLDVLAFRALLDANRRHAHAAPDTCAACLTRLEQAMGLYRGEFLQGFRLPENSEFEEWAFMEREQLHQAALEALGTLAAAAERHGDHAAQCRYARHQIELEPWREQAHAQLMRGLWASGQRSAALAQYEACRRVLHQELGIEPEETTKALYEQILVGALPSKPATIPKPQSAMPSPDFLSSTHLEPAAPFVARMQELAWLDDRLAGALAGRGQVVFVSGEAGSGKTALAGAFIQRAQTAHADLIVARGGCNAYSGVGDPYLPFREVLSLLVGAVEPRWHASMVTQQNGNRLWNFSPIALRVLADYGPDLIGSVVPGAALLKRAEAFAHGEDDWLQRLKQVARLREHGDGPALAQDRLFAQIAQVLQRLAAAQPLLLILEDLHWADPSSINLLFHLGRSIEHTRMLVIGTYRPEDVAYGWDGRPHPLQDVLREFKRSFGDIWVDLDQVTEAEGRQFIDALLDTTPNLLSKDFREALFQHTEGHALFTTELLHSLQERGDLRLDAEGRWMGGLDLNWQLLPTRVEGVIEKRIERLAPPLREALSVASVEGEEFTAEVVARVQAVNERDLVRQLGAEGDRQYRLVNIQRFDWMGPQRLSRYRFRHNMFQRYLYHTLDAAERVYLHTAVATVLETLYAAQVDQVAVQLASHYQAAGLVDKAVEYLRQAGEKARSLSANVEAITHFRQALALLATIPDSPERAQRELALQIPLGNALIATKGFAVPEVGQAFLRAQVLAERLKEPTQLFAVLHGLHHFYYMRGEWQAARGLGEKLIDLAESEHMPGLRTEAQRALGVVLWHVGEFAHARQHTEQGIAFYDRQHHLSYLRQYGQDPGVVCLGYNACALWLLGYPQQAKQRSEQTMSLARELAHPFSLARALNFSTMLHTFERAAQATLEHAEATISLAKEHGFTYYLGWGMILRGWALAEQGQGKAGIEQMLQGEAIWRTTGVEMSRHFYLVLLAEAYGMAGYRADGLRVLGEAVEAVPRSGQFWEAEIYRLKGELLLVEDTPRHVAEAEAWFRRALAVAQRQGAKALELRAVAGLSQLRVL